MKLTETTITPPFKYKGETRPWGYYDLYSHNEPCTTKLLFIKPNELLSLQYHFLRDQFYLLLDNDFTIEYSTEPISEEILKIEDDKTRIAALHDFLTTHLVSVTGKEGDMFGFKRCVVHRAQYNGSREYGRILDVAFGFNDELDIIRISDKYGRE